MNIIPSQEYSHFLKSMEDWEISSFVICLSRKILNLTSTIIVNFTPDIGYDDRSIDIEWKFNKNEDIPFAFCSTVGNDEITWEIFTMKKSHVCRKFEMLDNEFQILQRIIF